MMLTFRGQIRILALTTAVLAINPGVGNPVAAQILVPVQDQSQVDVTVAADVQFDTTSGLYTYTYSVTNGPAAVQDVWSFSVEADAEIRNIRSPQGWAAVPFFSQPIIGWAATEIGPLPPDHVDDGNILPSPFEVKIGQILGGFSFQSPSGPKNTTFYAQGFAPVPMAVSEDDFAEVEIPEPLENSFIGSTLGPGLNEDLIFTGGRRPSVDGFLAFVGLAGDRETLARPVPMVLRFGVNGETVQTSTFHAELNRVDVTDLFAPTGNGDLLAVFDLNSSPLEIGRNVLLTSVDGTVPGTTRTAADTDRLTFFVP